MLADKRLNGDGATVPILASGKAHSWGRFAADLGLTTSASAGRGWRDPTSLKCDVPGISIHKPCVRSWTGLSEPDETVARAGPSILASATKTVRQFGTQVAVVAAGVAIRHGALHD